MENDLNTAGANRRERTTAFIYVFMFFAVITAACCFILFTGNQDLSVFSDKMTVEKKLARLSKFQQIQNTEKRFCDSLYNRILRFDPGVQAKYDSEDIHYMINDLRREYRDNSDDSRYIVFEHIADFYQMWFDDRVELWGLVRNIEMLRKNVQDCELGLQKKQDELKSQSPAGSR